jgi:hypothetical protein
MLAVNLMTAILSLPFAAVVAVLALTLHLPNGVVLLVTGILLLTLPTPTAAGLHLMMRDLAHGDPVQLSDWWDGLRALGPLALRAWLVAAGVIAVIFANLAYYPRLHFGISPVVEIMWAYVLVLWFCIQVYVYPLIVEQQVKSVVLVYRNAFVLASSNRLVTVLITTAWVFVALLSTMSLFVTFLGFALTAGVQQNAALRLIRLQARTGPEGAGAG